MTKVVSTWFYQQSRAEGGAYAQVRGDSSTEQFRDVYRRCVALFFTTARRAVPDAELVLFLNVPWDPSVSATSHEVDVVLRRLGVRCEVLEYTFAPPPTWPVAWRNQFFVFDSLRSLAFERTENDQLLLLDSDIVWSGAPAGSAMWDEIAARGALTYQLDHGPDEVVNGASRRSLTALADQLGVKHAGLIEYSGGEFVGARGDVCHAIVELGEQLWPGVLAARQRNGITQIEEGHLLSICYAALGVETGTANKYVKRVWTQPFKFRNVQSADLALALWHVPAEKKYGIRRLYTHTLKPDSSLWSSDGPAYRATVSRALGIPRNSTTKVVRDVTRAIAGRVRGFGRGRSV